MCHDDLTDLRCLLRGCHRPPTYRYKIFYVGTNRALAEYLNRELKELSCFVDHCSPLWMPHVLIKSDIKYALLLVDEQLPETNGVDFMQYVASLPHRKELPVMVKLADDFNKLAQNILTLISPTGKKRKGG
jgi:CheY-like chemotaxis protein